MDAKTIQIKAFGMISEVIQTDQLEFPYQSDTEGLIKALNEKFPELRSLKYSIAINKKMVMGKAVIPLGAEIDLMPPFSGG